MQRKILPLSALSAWARLNRIEFHGVNIQRLGGESADKGFGVIADKQLQDGAPDEQPPLMTVPAELILTAEMVWQSAKVDGDLRKVLEGVGDFGRTDRGAILIFLLVQTTIASSEQSARVGVSEPWTEYVCFLQSVPLPTRWSEEEQRLLIGTSLQTALNAKLRSLNREFAHLEQATQGIPWCRGVWWNIDTGGLTLQDWLDVDAWYRSRVLQLPHTGNAMVPCLDMVNHRPQDAATAFYDQGPNGDAVLLRHEGKRLDMGQELSINYGDKSASEMVFSYGFIDEDMTHAGSLTLSLGFLDNDPLKKAKEEFFKLPAMCRLVIDNDLVDWESSFIWLMCVGEDDGLDFKVLQSVDGNTELVAFWKGEHLNGLSNLGDMLKIDPMWDLFALRAITILQQRTEAQLELLVASEEFVENATTVQMNSHAWKTACALRDLEKRLMEKAILSFQTQMETLINTSCVREYLELTNDGNDDDFS